MEPSYEWCVTRPECIAAYRAAHFVVNFGIENYSCTVNVAAAELP